MRVLITNKIKCLSCDEVLESKHQHDFVRCCCPNQAFVDGGKMYQRYGAMNLNLVEDVSDLIEMTEEEYEEYTKGLRVKYQESIQHRIDKGEMINLGDGDNPHWVNKDLWLSVIGVCNRMGDK